LLRHVNYFMRQQCLTRWRVRLISVSTKDHMVLPGEGSRPRSLRRDRCLSTRMHPDVAKVTETLFQPLPKVRP